MINGHLHCMSEPSRERPSAFLFVPVEDHFHFAHFADMFSNSASMYILLSKPKPPQTSAISCSFVSRLSLPGGFGGMVQPTSYIQRHTKPIQPSLRKIGTIKYVYHTEHNPFPASFSLRLAQPPTPIKDPIYRLAEPVDSPTRSNGHMPDDPARKVAPPATRRTVKLLLRRWASAGRRARPGSGGRRWRSRRWRGRRRGR